MSVGNELDINTLSWVKSEIDDTLTQAQAALESYVEDQDDESRLQFCLNYLHQVRGTLQMVELYGAAMAAEEMEHLVQELIDNQITNREDAYEVLMRGMLQLPDYLEHLLVGHKDMPVVLLPVLNDLRAARGEALLTENALFSPDMAVQAPDTEPSLEDISLLAKRLRHHYHLGLLGWFRDNNSDASLKRIAAVIEKIRAAATEQEVNRLLWVARGLVESLRKGGLDSSISIKLLLGQLDRQIKKIIDKGQMAISQEPPRELLKNLLYYVATSSSEDKRTQAIKQAFNLDEVMPDTGKLEQVRADLAGPNAALMGTVSSVLLDDLVQVKDNLDIFVRKEERELDELLPLCEKLGQMADTLGMMGLGIQRSLVLDQVAILQGIAEGRDELDATKLMDVAGAMLSLESSLKEASIARAVNEEVEELTEAGQAQKKLQEAERHKLLTTVIDQAGAELVMIKDALNEFSRYPAGADVLKNIPSSLDSIRGSLAMLDLEQAASLIEQCARYVKTVLLEKRIVPESAVLDDLADAISSIEYYLESLIGKWANPESILAVAEASLARLNLSAIEDMASENSGFHRNPTEPDIAIPVELRSESGEEDTRLDLEILQNEDTIDNLTAPTIEKEEQPAYPVDEETLQDIQAADIDLSSMQIAQPEFPQDDEFAPEEDTGELVIPQQEAVAEDSQAVTLNDIEITSDISDEIASTLADDDTLPALEIDWPEQAAVDETPEQEAEQQPNIHQEGDTTDFDLSFSPGAEETEERSDESSAVIEIPEDELSLDQTSTDGVSEVIEEIETSESSIEIEAPDLSDTSMSSIATFVPPEEIDEEILEIFLEEAEEEFENITRCLPAWEANQDDTDALNDMRRSFHTLKGSGRLVGAFDVGEFAWAFENMLNRVIDKSIVTTPVMFELLHLAHKTLPALFDYFKQGQRADQDILALVSLANDLSQGKEIQLPSVVTESPAEDETTEAAPAEQTESAEVLESGSEPEVETDGEIAAEIQEPQVPLPDIDPVLLDIYRKEVVTHLQTLQTYLADWQAGREQTATDALLRALHTLTGSSRTTGVVQIAELCSEFEKYIKALQSKSMPVTEPAASLLDNTIQYISVTMDVLDVPGAGITDNVELMTQVNALNESLEGLSADDISTPGMPDLQMSSEAGFASVSEPLETEADDELLEIFIEEGEEILDESDQTLSQWIETPEDNQLLEAMQRQLHTLKGGARMAGVSEIGDLGHSVESLLTALVDGKLSVSKRMFTVLQQAQDQLVSMLEQVKSRQRPQSPEKLIEQVESLLKPETEQAGTESVDILASDGAEANEEIQIDDIDENQAEDTTAEVDDSIGSSELSRAEAPGEDDGSSTGEFELSSVTGEVTEESSGMLAEEESGQSEHEPSDPDATRLPEEHDEQASLHPEAEPLEPASANDNVVNMSNQPFEDNRQQEPDEASSDNVVELSPPQVVTPPPEPKESRPPAASEEMPPPAETVARTAAQPGLVRVRADLMDNLVNFAGEVSIYRSRIEQQSNSFRYNLRELDDTVSRLRHQLREFEIETEAQIEYRKEETLSQEYDDFDPLEFDRFTHMQQLSRGMLESLNDLDSLRAILANITRESETLLIQQARVSTDLQEGLMRTRMVPFAGQAPRLRRIVRQTAQELGKEIEFKLHGLEGEIDRTVLDRIMPPIEHMLRNAVSHGIEMPEQRTRLGKPAAGRVDLLFEQLGSDIVIRVSDDGAGFNLDAIQKKAIEKGMIKPGSEIPRDALLNMVMESGFSTAEKVTQISGRGVGMDVVNTEIKQLGGMIKIDTNEGKGTAFTISMPMSLAITRALMVNVGEDTYAIPLLGVQGVERVSATELHELQQQEQPFYKWLDEDYRLLHLGSVLGTNAPLPPAEGQKVPLLLVRSGEYRAAIQVEGLIGSREVVVKPVGPQLSSLRGITGATIMGDGQVVLILDLGVLVRLIDTMTGDELVHVPAIEEEKIRVKPTIMVVDDSITVRKVTTRLLERYEYQVITAKDGVDALAQLQDVRPDVMLLDVEMPRMDGYELATNVRNDEVLKDIPIIMITSRTAEKHKQRAINIGVNAYLGKPYNEQELLQNIENLLD